MFEIERKYKIHSNHVKSFIDRLLHLGFELVSQAEQKTVYLSTKSPFIKLRVARSAISDVKIKTEYSIIRTSIVPYETKSKKIRTLPRIREESVSRFIVDSVLSSASDYLPTLTRFRRTFKKKAPEGLTDNKFHLIVVDFDDVQAIGNDNLFVEFKMMVENITDKLTALDQIDSLVSQLQPFIGSDPGDHYLNIIRAQAKRL